jgi:cytochrome c oxidase cbb3-type subunit III
MAKRDPHSPAKFETTGHEWDGITELNRPLPKWWLWTFYATIIWAIFYWLLMPSWPLITSYTQGWLGYSQRARVAEQVAQAKAEKAKYRDKIAATDLEAIVQDPELLSFALAGGEAAFGDNCAACHGRGAQGAFGYPNLRDDSWLWGDGTLEAIHQTILHGIRADDPETRMNQMPAFGHTNILSEPQIADVAEYVLSLSGNAHDKAAAPGAKIFAANCTACHGADGKGNPKLGAPDLTDELWLYAGDKLTVMETIRNGRGGVMPAWARRLDPETIKELAIYVHSLGGGR